MRFEGMVSSSLVTPSLIRSLDAVAGAAEGDPDLQVRVVFADGRVIEGTVQTVDPTELLVEDRATGSRVRLPDADVRAVDMKVPRRVREWTLAILAIPVVTAALIAYAQLPWVPARPAGEDMIVGFLILLVVASGLTRVPIVRRGMNSLLTRWQRVYDAGLR
jgi:hypothetical protein